MNPKTKFEKRVVKLKDSLPSDPPKGMKEWIKKDSLILSVKKNNLRVADVEISLKTFKILQCWGPCNQPTPYRDKIEQLIKDNIHLIKERMK